MIFLSSETNKTIQRNIDFLHCHCIFGIVENSIGVISTVDYTSENGPKYLLYYQQYVCFWASVIVCWAKQPKNRHFLEQGLVQFTILIHNSYGKFIIVMTKFFSWVKRVKNQVIIYTYLFIYLTLKDALKYSTIWKCLKLQNRTLKV